MPRRGGGMDFKVVELTKDNEKEYLDQVATLEKVVLENMESKGQSGQLFITGKDDISEYAHSKENTVLLIIDSAGKVLAATYVTQGQKPFTYNDITKYFKYGESYSNYVKKLYPSVQEYKKDLLEIYEIKIEAFRYAKAKILQQYPEYGDITSFLRHELEETNNHYHEKSVLRELINRYMSEYVQSLSGTIPNLQEKYERFYWITSEEISEEFGREVKPREETAKEYEELIGGEEEEYKQILKRGPLVIHELPTFNEQQYFTARTANTIELDTYITDPNDRRAGLARILLLEGIKKHMEEHFKEPTNTEMFLCSTLHRDNLSSKYVSEFFGLIDSLYVKRRDGRDREVHICKVPREQYAKYLEMMSKRVAVLYGYNPENIEISLQEQADILQNQLDYETSEIDRLTRIAKSKRKTYNGNIDYRTSKANKISILTQRLEEVKQEIQQVEEIPDDDKTDKGDR